MFFLYELPSRMAGRRPIYVLLTSLDASQNNHSLFCARPLCSFSRRARILVLDLDVATVDREGAFDPGRPGRPRKRVGRYRTTLCTCTFPWTGESTWR